MKKHLAKSSLAFLGCLAFAFLLSFFEPSDAVQLRDRCKVTTATTGTGTITLGAAISSFQTFANCGVTDAQVVRYCIEDGAGYEIGTGTYTHAGTTLSRTVIESSNSDAAISLSGTATVFVCAGTLDVPSATTATDTSPAVTDHALGLESDVLEKWTLADLFEVINGLTEDAVIDNDDDFIPYYDAGGSTADKINPEKIGVGKQPIPLLAGAGTVPSGGGIAGCSTVAAFDSGSNDVFLRQCSFSAGTDNAIYWTIPAPKGSDETVDWTVRIDWTSATTTDSTDNVIWTAAAVCFSNDDGINGNAFPAVDTVTDTQTASNDFLSSAEITAVTPAGSWAENDMCVLKVTRDADAAGDNFNGTAELINAMLYVTTTVNTDN